MIRLFKGQFFYRKQLLFELYTAANHSDHARRLTRASAPSLRMQVNTHKKCEHIRYNLFHVTVKQIQ